MKYLKLLSRRSFLGAGVTTAAAAALSPFVPITERKAEALGAFPKRLFLVFYAVMAAAGLITEGLFAALGAIPESRPHEIVTTRFEWNYTTFLNIVFLVIFAVLYWLYRNRERLGGGQGYALDPVCGMQVRTADAPAAARHDGRQYWFCADRCKERFDAAPARFTRGGRPGGIEEPGQAVDPVCGMAVDPATAPAQRSHDGSTYSFCNPGCAAAFDADPTSFATGDVPSPGHH